MTKANPSYDHGGAGIITFVVTMRPKPEHEQGFLDFAAAYAEKVRGNEPDTLLYTVNKHADEPHTYVWVERYRDEKALAAHSEAPYLSEAMDSWITNASKWAKPHEMIRLDQVVPS